MKQMLYALQFKGKVEFISESPVVARAATTSPSSSINSIVGQNGLESAIQPADGGEAQFESRVEMTGESSFQETGLITFGKGNALRFSTVNSGYIAPSPEEGVNHGTVMWKLEGGEGQFEGASGLITSNFTLDGQGEVVDNQFGVIYLK